MDNMTNMEINEQEQKVFDYFYNLIDKNKYSEENKRKILRYSKNEKWDLLKKCIDISYNKYYLDNYENLKSEQEKIDKFVKSVGGILYNNQLPIDKQFKVYFSHLINKKFPNEDINFIQNVEYWFERYINEEKSESIEVDDFKEEIKDIVNKHKTLASLRRYLKNETIYLAKQNSETEEKRKTIHDFFKITNTLNNEIEQFYRTTNFKIEIDLDKASVMNKFEGNNIEKIHPSLVIYLKFIIANVYSVAYLGKKYSLDAYEMPFDVLFEEIKNKLKGKICIWDIRSAERFCNKDLSSSDHYEYIRNINYLLYYFLEKYIKYVGKLD